MPCFQPIWLSVVLFECLDDGESKSGTGIHILWINISNLDETVEEFATENN